MGDAFRYICTENGNGPFLAWSFIIGVQFLRIFLFYDQWTHHIKLRYLQHFWNRSGYQAKMTWRQPFSGSELFRNEVLSVVHQVVTFQEITGRMNGVQSGSVISYLLKKKQNVFSQRLLQTCCNADCYWRYFLATAIVNFIATIKFPLGPIK